MDTKEEVLKQSPLWILKLMHNDMLLYASLLEGIPLKQQYSITDLLEIFKSSEDFHIRQIAEHLTLTSRCLNNYAYINGMSVKVSNENNIGYNQAKTTWDMISILKDMPVWLYEQQVSAYSERNYMYCIALWNSAYQILYNEHNVYNYTFIPFLDFFEYSSKSNVTFGDERTEPLFKLITQIKDFSINYEIPPKDE